ncbi:MAG: hypothetical protein Q9221_006482 [Calogaya cf. arnoldii]
MPDVHGSSQTSLDEVFPDPDFLSPKVLISVAVEEGQTYDAEDWKEWLLDCPAVARGMWVEGVYQSNSTILLLLLPVAMWDLLPRNSAISLIAFVRSRNLVQSTRAMTKALVHENIKSGKSPRPSSLSINTVTSPRKPTASGSHVSSDNQATLPDMEAVVNIGIDLLKFVFGFVIMTFPTTFSKDRDHPIKAHKPIKAYSDMPFEAYDPRGHTLGILGFDEFGLGLTIARMAKDLLGMKMAYHHGGGKSPAQKSHVDATFYSTLDNMLQRTDCLLIIALPQGSADAVMDNRRLVGLLPCGSRIVRMRSTNRINQDVLADALSSGHLAAAGLDRSESEPHFSERLVAMRNVEITNQNRGPTRISEEIVEESPAHVGLQAPTFSDAPLDVGSEDRPARVPRKVVPERVNKAAEDLSEPSSKMEDLPPNLDTIFHEAPSDPSSGLSRSDNPGVSTFPRASGSTKQMATSKRSLRKSLEWFRKPFHTDSDKRHKGKDTGENRY